MSWPARSTCVLAALVLVTACSSGTPTVPTQPTQPPVVTPTTPAPVTVTSVQVGVAGLLPPTLAPGDKLQLFAQATSSDGAVADVTNLAVWQSSNPVAATVSTGGVLTAFAEGALDVSATYQTRSGSLHAEVAQPGCRVTLSPPALSFGALSNSGFVTVGTTRSDCRWTAKSSASWLQVSLDPGRSGPGAFSYSVPGNNNVDARDADIVVSVAGGPSAIHRVHQERPVGCVYNVEPAILAFGAGGGTGSFNVTTIPGDCQWRISDTWTGITFTNGSTGTGAGRIDYVVAPGLFAFDRQFRIQGLSGLNPPAIHTTSIR